MPLFTTIPPHLFKPLASPGAAVYAGVLLAIFAETRRHQQPLSRDLALHLVAETLLVLEDGLAATQDAEEESPPPDDDPLNARAGAILRYLARSGWLRIETQSDFTQSYTLPDYAFRLLNVFHEIASDEPLPIQGLIFSIYSLLQTSLREGNAHISLPEAHRQTASLMSGLKELQHNIGVHIEQVLRQLQARDVLEQVFTLYHGEVMDKAYHQLRTTDHVSRFRPGVLEALTQLSTDQQLLQIAQSLRASGLDPSVEAAAARLHEQIREIRDQFELLDYLLQAIDVRHSQFVDSAVRTIELQLTASTTTSGQLHAILSHLLADSDAELHDDLDARIDLFALSWPDAESLAAPGRTATPFVSVPVPIVQPSAQAIAAAQQRTLEQLQRSISRERVRRYAQHLLGAQNEVRVGACAHPDADNLPLLIYLRQYGDGALGYRVEDLPDGAWVETDGIGFRDFMIRRS
ncbi:Wadjet anti-phage system protein JetA family protein [Candidatus Oscillochloris fontis]|uniref:Wadjet anti-phage system protein JetA family protein n=1 Tax=Candidatus Oscillochloris fontis TaxID=2496868 RepID=UPI00101C5D96|nr:Wadjet anti-phage system protein JetA family protein [Candidatus Oscillochloris fontis]